MFGQVVEDDAAAHALLGHAAEFATADLKDLAALGSGAATSLTTAAWIAAAANMRLLEVARGVSRKSRTTVSTIHTLRLTNTLLPSAACLGLPVARLSTAAWESVGTLPPPSQAARRLLPSAQGLGVTAWGPPTDMGTSLSPGPTFSPDSPNSSLRYPQATPLLVS